VSEAPRATKHLRDARSGCGPRREAQPSAYAMSPRVGQVINNKYRLLRHIGDGGMGSVFEARHETLGTTVALKFLHLEFSRREGLVQRFLQEARASAQIQSPNVVRVSDVDQTAAGDVFIVLEYLEGKTLQAIYEELYRGGKRLAYADALDYATQILEGVEAAHRAGIVHRDLKPDNVMVTADPKGAPLLKLLDFGIAKLKVIAGGAPGLTRPGVLMGTPEYMAPEQTSSAGTVDARADLFSIGVMIFEMLAGQRPTGGEDPHELAAAYHSGRISRLADLVPGIAPELADAVHRAIAARPEDRFASVADLRAAIEPFAAAVRPPSPSRLRAGGTIGVNAPATPMPSAAAPLPVVPPPSADPARPGVAKTWPPEDEPSLRAGSGIAGTMPDDIAPPMSGGPRASGTFVGSMGGAHGGAMGAVSAGPNGGSTQDMDPYVPLPALPAVAPRPARRRKKGMSMGAIVASALAVTGLVLGGVLLATRSSSSSDDDAPKKNNDPPPAVSVGQQPPPAGDPPTPPPPDTQAPVPMPPPQMPPPGGPSPGGPPPKQPKQPGPRPPGSAAPSAPPPSSPLVLPSQFPFPLPFGPGPGPAPAPGGSSKPKNQPSQPPPLFPPI
jgi:eukaryotic-like serine/threonine-protein kinase